MAAPPEVTTKNLTGKFVMNKTLSDDPDKLLALQGIGWLTRKAIAYATITLTIKQYTDGKSISHIDITSVASGLSTTQEDRTLDWEERNHTDRIFGTVKGRTRSLTLSSFEPQQPYNSSDTEFLQGKTLKDGKTGSRFLEGDVIQSYVKNQDKGFGWTAEQVWSFEEVQGKRYYTRRVVVRDAAGTKTERVRLVYNYLGKVEDDDDGLAYGEE